MKRQKQDSYLLTILVWGCIAAMFLYSCGLGGLIGGLWK
jgi:hypothetical protein